jgi:hypothetical protein
MELVIGGGLVLVGFILGRLHRPRRGPPKPSPEICECDHPRSMHNSDGCHQVELITEQVIIGKEEAVDYYSDKKYEQAILDEKVVDKQKCGCVHYVGPYTSYVPEIDS